MELVVIPELTLTEFVVWEFVVVLNELLDDELAGGFVGFPVDELTGWFDGLFVDALWVELPGFRVAPVRDESGAERVPP